METAITAFDGSGEEGFVEGVGARVPPETTPGRWAGGRFLLALVALLATIGCTGRPRVSVLLVTFDTTRADQIGAYGNDRSRTAAVDSLAAEGVRFARAYSSIALTLPSHTTILTGVYPPTHGIRDNGMFVVGDDVVTLQEILAEHGYATGAAIGGFPLVKRFNLDQGFSFYDDRLSRKDDDYLGRRRRGPSLYFEERTAGRVTEAILPWLEEHRDRPFFAWIHFYDPHRPWAPPVPYADLFADDLYKGEIAYADEMLGVVLDALKAWGVYERTLVVFTADHGEGLGEHNEETHSMLLYDSTLRVPLIIRPPGGMPAKVVDDLVGGVDLVPTILDLVDVPKPDHLQGRTLAGYLNGTGTVPRNRLFYAETLSPRLSHGWGELRALYRGSWKYIHGPRAELFDLANDPHERVDRLEEQPELAASMRETLARLIATSSGESASTAVPVDAKTRAQLMALGYLTGSENDEPIEEVLRDDGTPPQDRVMDINLSSEIRSHLAAGRGVAARQVALELLEHDPQNAFYHELLAQAHLASGQLDAAAEIVETLLADESGRGASADLLMTVGSRLFRAGQAERGIRLVRRSVELEATALAYYQLSTMEREQGNDDRELDLLRQTLEADPTYATARVDLAIRHAVAGERDAAREHFERALRDDPYYAKGHYNYGAFLMENGHLAPAEEHFRRAVSLDRSYLAAHLAVVTVEVALGRLGEAETALRELEAIAPNSEEARSAGQLVRQAKS